MKITDTKQLDQVLKVLRKQGVTHFKAEGLELTLGALPRKSSKSIMEQMFPEERLQIPAYNGEEIDKQIAAVKAQAEVENNDKIVTPDAPSEDELLNWSVREEPGTEDSTN